MSVKLLDLNKDWQQKRPELVLKKNEITFSGYQNYKIKNGIHPLDKKLKKKNAIISPELKELQVESVLDLGCAGLFFGIKSYYAFFNAKVTGVEIDNEYVEKLRLLSDHMKADFNIVHSRLDLFPTNEAYDLVFALAIIHWIYSCSSYFGSLEKGIEFLSKLTNKYIFIEFVDENDPVTKKLNHIKFNDAKPDYSKKHFLQYLNSYFSEVKFIGKVKSTREIYLCKK